MRRTTTTTSLIRIPGRSSAPSRRWRLPAAAAPYFSKIECFCFTEQTLKGGESVDMPVVFFVDPKIKEDLDTRDLAEITLSYTFYPVEKPSPAR